LLEDRWIGCHPAHAIFVDKFFQAAFGDKTARQKIEPYRLAVILQRFEGIHERLFLVIAGAGNLMLGNLILGSLQYLVRNETEFR